MILSPISSIMSRLSLMFTMEPDVHQRQTTPAVASRNFFTFDRRSLYR